MAARSIRPDGMDLAQIRPMRRSSSSSDVMSNSTKSAATLYQIPPANPPPAFIAQTEASNLVSAELDRNVDVSSSALTLLNEFLDHVLYSIISTSHSVAIGQLKAAVPAVLKPRLGKAALKVAEEELKEYIEDEEVDELYNTRNGIHPRMDFDTDLVWRLARLRCMVYARMGSLEEEDEEEWLEKEHLLEQAAALPSNARQSMAVTPGAAIFLTAVVEYLGEQALYYAAQYAQKRHDSARNQDLQTPSPDAHLTARHAEIVLEGKDMNHVGRDSPLSRLWRSWRRNTRTLMDSSSRAMSPYEMVPAATDSLHSRTTSNSAHLSIQPILEENRRSIADMSRPETPSQIPLPETDNDVDEIEGRGYVTDGYSENVNQRPFSMPALPGKFPSEHDTTTERAPEYQERSPLRPTFDRNRSYSLPAAQTPFLTSAFKDRDSLVLPIQIQEGDGASNMLAESESLSNEDHETTLEHSSTQDPNARGFSAKDVTGRRSTPSQDFNNNVGVLAGALGAVGVHHVGSDVQPVQVDRAQILASIQRGQSARSLTSASIRDPGDIDVMYMSDDHPKSKDQDQKRFGKSIKPQSLAQQYHQYQEQLSRQKEEHKHYSQELHEVDAPSIYAHQERPPRFPSDMRRTSSQADDSDRSVSYSDQGVPEEASSSYAPLSQAQPSYYSGKDYPPLADDVGTAHMSPKPDMASPTSSISSIYSHERDPSASNWTSGIPELRHHQTASMDEPFTGRSRGHSKSSSSSSRLLGFTRDASGRPQTIHQQKAAGSMSDDVRRAHSSTPTSMNQHGRPETANSTSPPGRPHLRIREDSDNHFGTAIMTDQAAKKRSLESPIHYDQALYRTATPTRAEIQVEDIKTPPRRSETRSPSDLFHSTILPEQVNTTPSHRTSSRKASIETSPAVRVVSGVGERKVIPSSKGVVPLDPATPKSRNPLGEPRDAKVDQMSGGRDLADYLRSTGPTNDDQLPQPLSRGTVAGYIPKQPAVTPLTSPAASSPQSAGKPTNRLKFQARDARPSRNAESSALIDFIREGPPRESGDHRINRHVAPFRTTMDSDDFNNLSAAEPNKPSEINGVRSIHTKSESDTPLITQPPKQGAPFRTRTFAQPDADDGMPKKTRRRVKDPYAIDESDDEMLDEPAPAQTHEESLMDFLRNTAPPPSMAAQPVLSSPPRAKSPLNRTPSIDKIKDFVRGTKGTTPALSTQSQSKARAESPHLTQSGTKLDSYRPTQVTHAAHVDRNRRMSRSESSASNRETPAGIGATADLADYLRNTGPPPTSEQQPQPYLLSNPEVYGVRKEDEGVLKKFFSMRGKKA